MGGLLAARTGLPVERFVVATNANDEVPRFLETGAYEKIEPSLKCISNAMNVGHPSNLARVVDLYGGQMDELGNLIEAPDMDAVRRDLFGVSVSDDATRATIVEAYRRHGTILEPHGAVGWAGPAALPREAPGARRTHRDLARDGASGEVPGGDPGPDPRRSAAAAEPAGARREAGVVLPDGDGLPGVQGVPRPGVPVIDRAAPSSLVGSSPALRAAPSSLVGSSPALRAAPSSLVGSSPALSRGAVLPRRVAPARGRSASRMREGLASLLCASRDGPVMVARVGCVPG